MKFISSPECVHCPQLFCRTITINIVLSPEQMFEHSHCFWSQVVAQIKRRWQFMFFRTRANSYTATTVSVRQVSYCSLFARCTAHHTAVTQLLFIVQICVKRKKKKKRTHSYQVSAPISRINDVSFVINYSTRISVQSVHKKQVQQKLTTKTVRSYLPR